MTDVRWQIVAYLFVSIVLWMAAAQLGQRRTSISWVRRLSQGWAFALLRLVYFIGVPYATLILGVLPARYLGLVGLDRLSVGFGGLVFRGAGRQHVLASIREAASLTVLDWLPDVAPMAGLTGMMLLLLSITWLGYAWLKGRVAPAEAETAPSPFDAQEVPPAPGTVYRAVHWSFYRGAAWLLTGDLYLGVMGGILLVGGEWLLDPIWTARVRRAPTVDERLTEAGLLIATSVMFLFVPNLWLLIPAHWLLATASRRWVVWGQRWAARRFYPATGWTKSSSERREVRRGDSAG